MLNVRRFIWLVTPECGYWALFPASGYTYTSYRETLTTFVHIFVRITDFEIP